MTLSVSNKPDNKIEKEKPKNIAEIMSLLIELQKDKDWILQEIKKHRLGVSVKRSMNVLEILSACPHGFISFLLRTLKNDDFDPNVKIPILTKTYHWFYTDIVGSADPTILTKDQARKVWVLYELISRTDTFKQRDPKSDVMTITGDGMVIGFSDYPEKPLHLAIELTKRILKYNVQRQKKDKLYIRVGIHTGPVYFIKDLTGKDNFWGSGIIMARRVMDMARPMQILASERIANDIRKLNPENKSVIHDAGLYEIKHGEKIKIFNIYGKDWGNKRDPRNKIDEESQEQSKFLFPKVEVKLDVTNPENMMTHHIWLWNVINVGEKPIDQVSYYLNGDVPREFSDLNISVKDENNKKLEIMSVNVNKPLDKEFIVKMKRPLKPNQKRKLKLEYNWEEPERKFFYTLSTDCKKFRYLFTAPKGLEIKPRILKVDLGTRAKSHASPPPKIKYSSNKTEIVWEAKNLHANNAFQFEW